MPLLTFLNASFATVRHISSRRLEYDSSILDIKRQTCILLLGTKNLLIFFPQVKPSYLVGTSRKEGKKC